MQCPHFTLQAPEMCWQPAYVRLLLPCRLRQVDIRKPRPSRPTRSVRVSTPIRDNGPAAEHGACTAPLADPFSDPGVGHDHLDTRRPTGPTAARWRDGFTAETLFVNPFRRARGMADATWSVWRWRLMSLAVHVLQVFALGLLDPLPDEEERQERAHRVEAVGHAQAVRSAGKVTVIDQLATHWPAAARPSAAARMRFGNISPSSTHTTGPQDMPNATTNRLAAIRAIGPGAGQSTRSRLSAFGLRLQSPRCRI